MKKRIAIDRDAKDRYGEGDRGESVRDTEAEVEIKRARHGKEEALTEQGWRWANDGR